VRVKKFSGDKTSKKLGSRESKSSPGVPRTVWVDPLSSAVSGLLNNETKVMREVKANEGTERLVLSSVYPKELVAAFRGMFSANKEYSFEMRFVTASSTTAGGALLIAIPLSPSVSSYAEWSALAALFDEVKAVETVILVNNVNAGNGNVVFEMPCAIACDHVNLSSTPASTLAVIRLAGSTTFSTIMRTTAKICKAKFTDRLWCITGTPYSQSPLGGCIGSWSIGNMSIGAGTTAYISSITRLKVKLRCRA